MGCSWMTLKCEFRESAGVEPPNQEPSPNGHGSHEKRRLKKDEDEAEGRLSAVPDRLVVGHKDDHKLQRDEDTPLFCDLVFRGPLPPFLSMEDEPITAPLSVDAWPIRERLSVDVETKRASLFAVGGPIGTPLFCDGPPVDEVLSCEPWPEGGGRRLAGGPNRDLEINVLIVSRHEVWSAADTLFLDKSESSV